MSTGSIAGASLSTGFDPLAELYTEWRARRDALAEGRQPTAAESIAFTRELFDNWGKLTTEVPGVDYETVSANGVPAIWARPAHAAEHAAILFIHGGGYIGGSSWSHRKLAAHIANSAGIRALVIDYRLAPEHRMPSQLHDCRAAFDWLVESGIEPFQIALVGDSAGGALATTLALDLKLCGAPQAAAIAALSPYYDIQARGTTFQTNARKDSMGGTPERMAVQVTYWLPEGASMNDPYLNLMASDPTGLPPMHISYGGFETLLDGGRQFAELARSKRVDVEFDEVPEMQHVFQFAAGITPEASESVQRIGEFVRRHVKTRALA